MLVTEYAKGNELDFRVESLKVYGVLEETKKKHEKNEIAIAMAKKYFPKIFRFI